MSRLRGANRRMHGGRESRCDAGAGIPSSVIGYDLHTHGLTSHFSTTAWMHLMTDGYCCQKAGITRQSRTVQCRQEQHAG